jgi:hypothetical protein
MDIPCDITPRLRVEAMSIRNTEMLFSVEVGVMRVTCLPTLWQERLRRITGENSTLEEL